ncbi:tol-pal system protein YbgF [Tabrizicola sp. J26]|uniref:tol-pal system protein YbgF n=1 Tax=Alitabrizicola rongguiensis TaxID=2909234 RepID=UPI001F3F2082|nr:tol-pal system protein YbgF [Tabrizicola rongguiensis]MCF1707303.1 tol-pal system protein YbgF [Tabrizicola rongguiensis]
MRRLIAVLVLVLLPVPALAQDRTQTLADIRAELNTLTADVNSLKAELTASGASNPNVAGGSALQRMDAIEAALAELTSKTEELQNRINRVVTDGTNRIGDLEFRVTELEGGDVSKLGDTAPLGGQAAATVGAAAATSDPAAQAGSADPAPDLAVNEKADFDRAKGVLGQGDFRAAADQLKTFTETYPGSPLSAEALLLRGDALTQLGDIPNAARSYLESFSGTPNGSFAPDALLRLGQSLGTLGQTPEACVTLKEVGARFPGTEQASQATVSLQGMACQ